MLKNPEKVKAVVSYEPGTEFVFPEDDLPSVATSANDAANISLSQSISVERFALLTKMPITIYLRRLHFGRQPTLASQRRIKRIHMAQACQPPRRRSQRCVLA